MEIDVDVDVYNLHLLDPPEASEGPTDEGSTRSLRKRFLYRGRCTDVA